MDGLLEDITEDALHVASKPSSPPAGDTVFALMDKGNFFGDALDCRSMMNSTTYADPTVIEKMMDNFNYFTSILTSV